MLPFCYGLVFFGIFLPCKNLKTGLNAECFSFDGAEVESAVVSHKMGDGFELAFDKGFVVARNCDTERGDLFAVIMVDFRNGYVEAALQPADDGFDYAALLLERADTLKVQIGCHNTYYHNYGAIYLFRRVRAIKYSGNIRY